MMGGLQDRMFGELAARGEFDHYVRLVRQFVGVPVALVSLVGSSRQVFPGVLGLREPFLSQRQTPLTHSFCQYVVADGAPMVITDARVHPQLFDNDAVTDLDVIAYAGWPLRDAEGRVIGSLCAIDDRPRDWSETDLNVLRDLAQACSAELQAAMRTFMNTEHLAQTIFDGVNVAMAFYDHDGQLVMANDLARHAASLAGFQLDQEPYAGEHVRQADNRTPIELVDQIIPRALRGDLDDHEMEWVGPPGRQVAVVASSKAVSRDDGSPWGVLIAAHDVTDLARALQVKEEIVATVSHELRTPLTSIIGHTMLIEEQLDADAGMQQSVRAILRNAERLHTRIDELIDSADHRRLLRLESTDMTALIEEVASTFAEPARRAELRLTVDLASPQHAVVDPGRITQALENLLSNAVKYTPAGGQIIVGCAGDDATVTLSVTDDGFGMAPDEAAQAFDTFWRADGARRSAIQGIGLGLSLVRDIAQAHHGTVKLNSTQGAGTTVTLQIPRVGSSPVKDRGPRPT